MASRSNNITLNNSSHFINYFYENKLFLAEDKKPRGALFLDRDGVIIKEKHFISNVDDVELESGVLDLFEMAYKFEFPIVIVTNQSGIARGYFNWENYIKITDSLIKKLIIKNTLIAIYANGLDNNAPNFSWRKPSPSMILNASFSLNLDLSKSIIIGDRLSDLISAFKAGINKFIHIKTGHGLADRDKVKKYFNKIIDNKSNLNEPLLIDQFDKSSLNKISKIMRGNAK